MAKDDFFATARKEVPVKRPNGETVIFHANEIGYLEVLNIGLQAQDGIKNYSAMLIAASITDPDGNKFTYEEALRLKKEVAAPFFKAIKELHGFGEAEKN